MNLKKKYLPFAIGLGLSGCINDKAPKIYLDIKPENSRSILVKIIDEDSRLTGYDVKVDGIADWNIDSSRLGRYSEFEYRLSYFDFPNGFHDITVVARDSKYSRENHISVYAYSDKVDFKKSIKNDKTPPQVIPNYSFIPKLKDYILTGITVNDDESGILETEVLFNDKKIEGTLIFSTYNSLERYTPEFEFPQYNIDDINRSYHRKGKLTVVAKDVAGNFSEVELDKVNKD